MAEKTEKPSSKKIREARKKGLFAFSKELNTALLLIISLIIFYGYIDLIKIKLNRLFIRLVSGIEDKISHMEMINALQEGFFTLGTILTPVLLIFLFIVLLTSFLQIGFRFNFSLLAIKMERISLIRGLKRMFSLKALIEAFKAIIKAFICGFIFVYILKEYFKDCILLINFKIQSICNVLNKVSIELSIKVLSVFLLIAIIDVVYQRWDYFKNLRMSKEELIQELKQEEGDPLINSKRKQMHKEIAMANLVKDVSKANVIIVNPDEIAVALYYERYEMSAPVVIAKGIFHMAEYIKDIARGYDIPIIEDIALAHELIKIKIGDEIPKKLYEAVAEIYKVVYELKGYI